MNDETDNGFYPIVIELKLSQKEGVSQGENLAIYPKYLISRVTAYLILNNYLQKLIAPKILNNDLKTSRMLLDEH